MAITATEVALLDSTSNSSSYTSGSGSPAANRTLYAVVEISEASGVDPEITDANVSGWGLSWTRVHKWTYDTISVTHALFIFKATTGGSAPGSGSFATGTLPSGAATGCQMSIVEVDGDDRTGEPWETTNVQDDPASPDTSASVQSVTMNAFGAGTHKYLYVVGLDGNSTLTPDDTVTTLHDNVIATPAQRLTVLLGPEGDNTPSSTTGSATIWGAIALELRAAAAGGDTLTGTVLTVTPSLPTGAVRPSSLVGVVVTATPSLPTGAVRPSSLVGTVLAVTPSLPAGELTVPGAATLTGVVLTVTPSLPAGALRPSLHGVVVTATPSLPTGAVRPSSLVGVALTATPSLPVGALRPSSILGVALTATPALPVGALSAGANLVGVALTATPYLPAGEAPWTGSAVYDGVGSVTWGTDRITVDAAGSGDFWGGSDSGTIVYRPLVGGVDEVHLLSYPTGGHPRLFQLRKSDAANAAFYAILLDSDGSHITTVWRDTDGASAGYAGDNTGVVHLSGGRPLWLRITYSGSTATAYASQDGGTTWEQVGTRSVSGLTLAGVTNGGGAIGGITTVFDRGPRLDVQVVGVTLSVPPVLPAGALTVPVDLLGVVLTVTPTLPVGAVMVPGEDWHRIDGSRTEDWHLLGDTHAGDWHRLEDAHAGDHHRLDDTHSGDWHRQDGTGRGDWHRQE